MSDFLKSLQAYIPTKITNDPALDGMIFKAIAILASVGGTWLATKFNITDPKQIVALEGDVTAGLVVVACFVWGWIVSRTHQQTAVTAGMIASAPGIVSPISKSDATAIVKAFTPNADQLNQAELDKVRKG